VDLPVEGVDAQELLALAFENSPLGMTLSVVSPVVPGAPRHFAFKVNKAFADMLGYTIDELVGTKDQGRFTFPEDRLQDMANLQALLAGDQAVAEWDKRYIHADGLEEHAEEQLARCRRYGETAALLMREQYDELVPAVPTTSRHGVFRLTSQLRSVRRASVPATRRSASASASDRAR
jgi:PAS domain S-box-containing protein